MPGPLVRTAWVAAVLLVCATAVWALLSMPMGPHKKVVLFALTTLWIGGGFLAVGWTRIRIRPTGVLAAGYVAAGAVAAAAIALMAGWAWLDYTNAAMSLLFGTLTFLLLERRQRLAFSPRLRGAVHASLAVAASYSPVAIVWLAIRA